MLGNISYAVLTLSYAKLTRDRCGLRRRLAGNGLLQAVAEAAHGDDSHIARFELSSQPVDVDLDRVRRDLLAPLAKMRHQLLLGDEPAGALEENLEQAHFARRKLERRPVQPRDAPDLVVRKRSLCNEPAPTGRAASGKCAHARFELRKLERL